MRFPLVNYSFHSSNVNSPFHIFRWIGVQSLIQSRRSASGPGHEGCTAASSRSTVSAVRWMSRIALWTASVRWSVHSCSCCLMPKKEKSKESPRRFRPSSAWAEVGEGRERGGQHLTDRRSHADRRSQIADVPSICHDLMRHRTSSRLQATYTADYSAQTVSEASRHAVVFFCFFREQDLAQLVACSC